MIRSLPGGLGEVGSLFGPKEFFRVKVCLGECQLKHFFIFEHTAQLDTQIQVISAD